MKRFTLKDKELPLTITFEGFYDNASGWEFEMPVHMVKPVYRAGAGGNRGAIEYMVEDVMLSLDADGDVTSQEPHGFHLHPKGFLWPYLTNTAMNHFYKARKNKAREGIRYWKAEVTIKSAKYFESGYPIEINWEYKEL